MVSRFHSELLPTQEKTEHSCSQNKASCIVLQQIAKKQCPVQQSEVKAQMSSQIRQISPRIIQEQGQRKFQGLPSLSVNSPTE